MPYGVTADGFVRKPIETILEEIQDDQKASLGSNFDVSASSPAGQINSVVVTQLDELWEVAAAIYASIDPDRASGESLSALSALSGTVREAATRSTVTATVNLNAGVTLPAGAVASVSGAPTSRFRTIADATNSGGAPANVDVEMEAEETGPVVANTGTLTVIETVTTGWNSVTNAADADLGEEEETDAELRVRREDDLRRAGAGAVGAIEADINAVENVESVTVYENYTDDYDADGVPPHAFEAVVLGGTANDIAQAIWDSKPCGIEAYGTSTGTATDSDGNSQSVDYTIPAEVDIYIDVEVTVDGDYAATGDADIKTALATFGQTELGVGDDVIWSELFGIIFSVSGVVDVTVLETGFAPAPAGTSNLAIGTRQIANIDTANITVVST